VQKPSLAKVAAQVQQQARVLEAQQAVIEEQRRELAGLQARLAAPAQLQTSAAGSAARTVLRRARRLARSLPGGVG
jgi:hypothetical protein